MAISRTKDGRVFVYWREIDPEGKSAVKKKYFGRGPDAEAEAKEYNESRNFQRRRPAIPRTGPTFGELAELYTAKKRFSPNSEKHLLIRLSANILPFFGNLQAVRIRENDVDRYVDRRLETVKASTVRREITDLQAVLNFAVDRRLIPYNPLSRYRKPAPDDEIIMPPTVREISVILKNAAEHLKRAVLISLYTGVRVGRSELFKIRWIDVDLDLGVIEVQSANKGGPSRRRVPIHDELSVLLKEWRLADGAAVETVVNYYGRPVKSIKKAWNTAKQKAKITRRLRPYDLRHWNITTAIENGADIKTLSQIVGSRPETLIKFYQHVSKEMHRLTVKKIPGLGIGHTQKNMTEENKVIQLKKRVIKK